ncbi:MAG: hypothetical protein ACI843_001070 [Psychrobacter glaciei]|jgi:hypothetical protein
MSKKLPLLLMFAVLIAPFAISLVLLENKDSLGDRANGSWLTETLYVNADADRHWQLLWKKECGQDCDQFTNLLKRVKMALGKRQGKLVINPLEFSETKPFESETDNKIFIADQNGLLLLSYNADEAGAYKLLKDLKTLMKNGGA